MTHQPEEDKNTAVEPGVETLATRKLWPFLAFLAGFFGLGLGYVYVGRLRMAIATLVAVYGAIALFSWTRLIVLSAVIFWLDCAVMVGILVIALIHPIVIAWRNRVGPRKGFTRWWVYIVWIAVTDASGYAIAEHRAGLLGYATFHTPTESMSPTIERDEFFMANTWWYNFHKPLNGEIVVFEKQDAAGVNYVKRVVGVPGDQVELRNGALYRNGQSVAEPYVRAMRSHMAYGRDFGPTLIGPGVVFVLGDYRDNSMDSRAWGPIPIDHLHGRAQYIWFSMADGAVRWNRVGISLRP